MECEYCGHHFNASRQLKDKDWAFRRSGLFGRDDHQEGGIPVVLTLQQLMQMHHSNDGMFTTAMTLVPEGADIRACETDFVVLSTRGRNEKIQLAIGECKTSGEITEADVQNLTSVAGAFPISQFDVFILFAKLGQFTDDELSRIKTANPDNKMRAIIFSDRELEPYFLYERTAEEFAIDKTVVDFQGMAVVTDQVFFQKIRRADIHMPEGQPR